MVGHKSNRAIKDIVPVSRAPLLHITVQENLKTYIQDNNLKGGDPLPAEAVLAQQLGVGRNSMREAIKALESLGILEVRRGIGVFVKEFSFQPLLDNLAYGLQDVLRDVDELRIVRSVLETGLIGKTIEIISETELAELFSVTDQMKERALANESIAEEDQRFHQLLFACQKNRVLSELIDIFWVAFTKASNFNNLDNPAPLDTWRDHHEIVEAIAAKNVPLAQQRLKEHYRGIQSVIANSRVK